MIQNFGAWAPDKPRLGNQCITATNVLPVQNGYAPFPGPVTITDALAAPCLGVISFKQVDGTVETFAGTATKLYRLSGTSWTDVSRTVGGAYSTGTFWRFAVYGKRLVATNGIDDPQAFDLGTDTDFADLPNAPICTSFIVIRDVLVALGVNDGSVFQIKWSAVNDSEKWTADCGGGAQQVPDGGPVIGGTGGEFGVILQEDALTRMNFVGGELRFTFDKIEGAIGCVATDSIVEHKGFTFYLSHEGFQVFNGAESQNISDDFVSDFFFDDANDPTTTKGALDPANSVVVWRYSTSSGARMILYNYRNPKWAYIDMSTASAECVHLRAGTSPILAAFDGTDILFTFSGTILSAILSTGDLNLAQERNVFVKSARGLVDGEHEIRIGKKFALSDTETIVKATALNGKASIRANARYHRFELRPSGTTWTEAIGVDIEVAPSGRRT